MAASQPNAHDEETAEYPPARPDLPARFFAPGLPPVRVEFGALSHPGKVRPNNEDHYLIQRLRRTLSMLMTNLPDHLRPSDRVDEDAYCLAVADGMGGVVFGELASGLALRTLTDLVLSAIKWTMKLNRREMAEADQKIQAYYDLIDQSLMDRTWAEPRTAGMATTLTGAYTVGPVAFIAHAGDSRAYHFRNGVLKRLTHDHTLAQELADVGAIEPEEVATHRLRNTLTNYLGGPREGVQAQVVHLRLADGDRLLLCTDGLTDLVSDDEIATLLMRHPVPQSACQALVELALERGGKDNVTVVIGKYEVPSEE
jgi:protein phosphatase